MTNNVYLVVKIRLWCGAYIHHNVSLERPSNLCFWKFHKSICITKPFTGQECFRNSCSKGKQLICVAFQISIIRGACGPISNIYLFFLYQQYVNLLRWINKYFSSSDQIRTVVFRYLKDFCNNPVKTKSKGSEVEKRLQFTGYNDEGGRQSDENSSWLLEFEFRERELSNHENICGRGLFSIYLMKDISINCNRCIFCRVYRIIR